MTLASARAHVSRDTRLIEEPGVAEHVRVMMLVLKQSCSVSHTGESAAVKQL